MNSKNNCEYYGEYQYVISFFLLYGMSNFLKGINLIRPIAKIVFL